MITLVVHTGGIGDFLLACPALQALARRGPIVLVGRRDRLELAVAAGIARAAYDLDEVGFHSLFAQPSPALKDFLRAFDRAVVWMRDEDGSIARGLSACGVRHVSVHPGLPPETWRRHASAYFLDRLDLNGEELFRLEDPPVPPGARTHDIVIHPGSGSPAKNWPAERFKALAHRFEEDGRTVEWCLGPAELESGMAARLHDRHVLPEEPLPHRAATLSRTALYIGNDSGITHLAAAVGCPTVAIFGPTDPCVWAPRGGHVTIVHEKPWPDVDAVYAKTR